MHIKHSKYENSLIKHISPKPTKHIRIKAIKRWHRDDGLQQDVPQPLGWLSSSSLYTCRWWWSMSSWCSIGVESSSSTAIILRIYANKTISLHHQYDNKEYSHSIAFYLHRMYETTISVSETNVGGNATYCTLFITTNHLSIGCKIEQIRSIMRIIQISRLLFRANKAAVWRILWDPYKLILSHMHKFKQLNADEKKLSCQ